MPEECRVAGAMRSEAVLRLLRVRTTPAESEAERADDDEMGAEIEAWLEKGEIGARGEDDGDGVDSDGVANDGK